MRDPLYLLQLLTMVVRSPVWNITFSGSNMPVEKFIYMITSLTKDCLGGNFKLLCEHSHILFTSKAKEWYWRHRNSVGQIEWDGLCNALRVHFNDHLSDLDVREMLRERKQNLNECFDDFYHSILQLCDRLKYPLSEQEMVEILRRNLKPYLRRELFYLQINSVSHLRQLILRRETLGLELDRNQKVFRRQINEVDLDENLEDDKLFEDVCEIGKQREEGRGNEKTICWNCRKDGHRYIDCLEDRTIFCYGCGLVGVCRPQCEKCQGNAKVSVSNNISLRSKIQ